jgi:hypothetical protein
VQKRDGEIFYLLLSEPGFSGLKDYQDLKQKRWDKNDKAKNGTGKFYPSITYSPQSNLFLLFPSLWPGCDIFTNSWQRGQGEDSGGFFYNRRNSL